ncbi:MAG TPA: cytochrome d ubiquinol oxidase subunit II, partial [Gammaproteobacteria bacterium]|nr:cytochrome d ubiquinol oxidase subunit II [Gammaproteobacteria bacterium]
EFRFKAHKSRFLWDIAFCFGSSLAALCQGLVLGAVVQGLDVANQRYVGGPFDWFTPFSLMTALSVMVGYALLGAGWLIMKTEGDLRTWSYKAARWLLLGLLIGIGIVSIWTPLTQPAIAERWFSLPNFYFLSQIPLLTLLLAGMCWYVLKREKHDKLPFVFSIGLFLLAFVGLIISLWPYIVPRAITYEEAAAADSTLIFVLIGLLFLLPLVIAYTVMAYRIFSGKVRQGEGYH